MQRCGGRFPFSILCGLVFSISAEQCIDIKSENGCPAEIISEVSMVANAVLADPNFFDSKKERIESMIEKSIKDSYVSKFNKANEMDSVCIFCGSSDADPSYSKTDKLSCMRCYQWKKTWKACNLNSFGLTLFDCIKLDRGSSLVK